MATPIGDAKDVSARALEVLRNVDVIAAEDTRVALKLLRTHGIEKPLRSCWDGNEEGRTPEIVGRLLAGEDVALVSDAGTPLVSDPGYRVVRAAVAAGATVSVVPGPCAAIAGLCGSALPTDRFYFGGFLPRDDGPRRRALEAVATLQATLIFYESPLRLHETLRLLAAIWPERQVCVARNLTGIHEQWIRGTAATALVTLGEETRGEVTLLVEGAREVDTSSAWEIADRLIAALQAEGRPVKEIRDEVVAATGLPKREVYQRVLGGRGTAG